MNFKSFSPLVGNRVLCVWFFISLALSTTYLLLLSFVVTIVIVDNTRFFFLSPQNIHPMHQKQKSSDAKECRMNIDHTFYIIKKTKEMKFDKN